MDIEIKDIETSRLVLRKYNKLDLNDFIEHKDDPRLHEYLPTKPKEKKSDYKKALYQLIKESKDFAHPRWVWAIALKENKVVGSVSIEGTFERHKQCEIGWSVNVNYHKRGIGFEATAALINHIFKTFDMHRIEAVIWEGNEASIALAKKLGFTHEGTLRDARIKEGKYYDEFVFSILREEWEKQNYSKI